MIIPNLTEDQVDAINDGMEQNLQNYRYGEQGWYEQYLESMGYRLENRIAVGNFRIVGTEHISHFSPNFKVIKTDARSEPSLELAVGNLVTHRCDRGFDHASNQTLPTGVNSANNSSLLVGQQHRQAVGHLHHANRFRLRRDLCIGLDRFVRHIFCVYHRNAMYLRHPSGFRRAQISHNRAIHAHAAGIVAHAAADVEPHDAVNAAPRAGGDAAHALGKQSAHPASQVRSKASKFTFDHCHLIILACCIF